ncbi:MAG TPA: arsenate reductase ArsC [Gammaproteobacteria bacterium]|nr:arsenate reductase ArsC [Gammaproteobacteria bacterium]
MAEPEPYRVLFLCTGNSARSPMAEALLNRWGRERFVAYSAGSTPKGFVHPQALAVLSQHRMPGDNLHSKHWQRFMAPEAPRLDFVFTLCDRAAREICPVWPGHPITANWSVPDPAAVATGGVEQAFRDAFRLINTRIKLFTSLRPELLERQCLRREVERIGRTRPTENDHHD